MDKDPTTSPARQTILVVDDDPGNLNILGELLQGSYEVRAATSGERALAIAGDTPPPDLILLDVLMPGMDGYAVLAELRENPATHDIPVIFVTGQDAAGDEEKGLGLGAVDYIAKPYRPAVISARVRTHLELKAARDTLAGQKSRLEALVAERTQALNLALEEVHEAHDELQGSYFQTLLAIGNLVELRGGFLGEHARRVADLSRQLAQRLGMSGTEVQEVFVAALLHDVGKIGFSDELLGKPVSMMSGVELAQYRQHPALAADVLKRIKSLGNVADIILNHHEHFDGSGFPDRRSGLDIPLGACIVCAVSDYDDLTGGMLTAQPMTAKQACEYLIENRNRRYAAVVIDRLEPLLASQENFEIDEVRIPAIHLLEGMQLSREIRHPDGYLLLSVGTPITHSVIRHLVEVEKSLQRPLGVYVTRQSAAGLGRPTA